MFFSVFNILGYILPILQAAVFKIMRQLYVPSQLPEYVHYVLSIYNIYKFIVTSLYKATLYADMHSIFLTQKLKSGRTAYRRLSPRQRTLTCYHTAIDSICLPFNGLHPAEASYKVKGNSILWYIKQLPTNDVQQQCAHLLRLLANADKNH